MVSADYVDAHISDLIGKTLVDVKQTDDTITFVGEAGSEWMLYHEPDCCEQVFIEDVNGDWQDLVGTPIVMAEVATNKDSDPPGFKAPEPEDYRDSWTWTFYKFATVKGYVNARWYGESNGYYSEEVTFAKVAQQKRLSQGGGYGEC